ncbi:MAG TPA: ABC transporter substrate-binding protein [Candidatus Acidoferrales bacterium]|nr:ABC transporter substrate-binding protein [Candidatus Acidoferrales bacterium]
MKHTLSRRLVVSSVALAIAALVARPAKPARRPHYGGTLRVEIGASVTSLDPAAKSASSEETAAKRQIESLIYENSSSGGTTPSVAGSGPFRISEWEPGKQLTLVANDDYSGGRPFVDAIEIDMGRSVHDRLTDLEVGRTDFSEIPAEDARQAAGSGVRITASRPDELLAIVVSPGHPATSDARLRQAVAYSLNRAAIVDFILQREGEPAGGLLPQWSSGTAFLFPTTAEPSHAKELRSQIAGSPLIRLGYDSGDVLEESIADRISVDAREVGISIADAPLQLGASANRSDARLVRVSMISPHPAVALAGLLSVLNPLAGLSTALPSDASSAQEIYTAQRSAVGGFWIVPVVWVPRVYGLSSRIRDWQTPATGDTWPLANVWLDMISSSAAKQN